MKNEKIPERSAFVKICYCVNVVCVAFQRKHRRNKNWHIVRHGIDLMPFRFYTCFYYMVFFILFQLPVVQEQKCVSEQQQAFSCRYSIIRSVGKRRIVNIFDHFFALTFLIHVRFRSNDVTQREILDLTDKSKRKSMIKTQSIYIFIFYLFCFIYFLDSS